MRGFLRKAGFLVLAWALILLGVAGLRVGGQHLGGAIGGLLLIGIGVLLGMAAQLSMPTPPRESPPARRPNR